jgi:hypothetical protein
VLLARDATRLLVRFVLQVGAFAAGHDAIGFRAAFDAVQMTLAGGEATRFAHRQLTAANAVGDALALMVLAGVEPGSARLDGTGHRDREGETETRQ